MMRVTIKPIDVHLAGAASRQNPPPSQGHARTSGAGRVLLHPNLGLSASSPDLGLLLAGRARPPAAVGRVEVSVSIPDDGAALAETKAKALKFDTDSFLEDDAQPWFSPNTRAILNTGGVDLFKGFVSATANWGLHSLIANSNDEKSEDPALTQTYAMAVATVVGAIGVTQLAMKVGKLAVSHCTYGDPAAENDPTSTATIARACTSANTRRALSVMSGVAGGALAFAGASPIKTAAVAQTILAPVVTSLVGAIVDYVIKPHVTTYKTDSSASAQGSMAFAKSAAGYVVDLSRLGPMGPVANLYGRAFVAPIVTASQSYGGIRGEIVEPAPRKPLSEVVRAALGDAAVSAGAGVAVASAKGAIDLCFGAKPGDDDYYPTDVAKNVAGVVINVVKPIVDKRIYLEKERREVICSQPETPSPENVDAPENSELCLNISRV